MATAAQWIEGVRLRTLPAALSPVVAGTAVAYHAGAWDPLIAVGCLVVALALQVGVNFANDYSDGIRGTDAERVGPLRLVGSGAASPQAVKNAAFCCFGVASGAGLVVVERSGHWWLLAVGAACILAAWFYTGGRHPYGYAGLGEVFVFVFFGLVAVLGTVYVQSGGVPVAAWWAAVAVGNLACAVLVANNLRDIDTDIAAGKRTLATIMKDEGTRWLYASLAVTALVAVAGAALVTTPWALLGLAAAPLLGWTTVVIVRGALGRRLIGVLRLTGIAELVASVGLALGLVIG
ncbi:1,4-dihydroxy-2-naphthoate polyprenyltransferase [Propionicicella superfundia]|uniref:1,4-dihydroxy-2-naphthoate polyprenyltransferase n=1 Tax=Propionicicella superfundia TaxID=348582 RepID=UPI000403ED42|nr:1,4-dihydroxy-2-naphthoate polyprenyltransferase [Propionicicella superfundia]